MRFHSGHRMARSVEERGGILWAEAASFLIGREE